MRTLLALTIACGCLLLAGCQSSRGTVGRTTGGGGTGGQTPFLGTPVGSSGSKGGEAPAVSDSGSLTSSGDTAKGRGILAGRILDPENRLRPGAIIQVVDLEASREATAPLSVMANREGYFDISGLETGRSYRLIARVKDGGKVFSGSARVVPPNVRIAIFLNDEAPAENAVADAGPSAVPEGRPSTPAASLGAPIRNPSAGVPTPPSAGGEAASAVPPAVSTADPSLIADDKRGAIRDGFQREAPRVDIPNPGRDTNREKPPVPYVPPPLPSGAPSDEPAPVTSAPPSNSAALDVPKTSTRVPSCIRVGHRVENFALYDTKGNVYELARERKKGTLVLLDMWYTSCGPCVQAIPKLNTLQTKYGSHGLEVIGITYEQGTLAEKQQTLEQASRRFRSPINYRLLFGGGGKGDCPVAAALDLHHFPTLVLLDDTGRILWRGVGLDDRTHYELEKTIYDRLIAKRSAGR